jgi:hypothetical protein
MAMAGLKTYTVKANGNTATLRLSDADAKARGLTSADLVGAKKSAPKAKAPAAKAAPPPLNKSRTAPTKAE